MNHIVRIAASEAGTPKPIPVPNAILSLVLYPPAVVLVELLVVVGLELELDLMLVSPALVAVVGGVTLGLEVVPGI
jgi:hypothetical protein